jgi:outer membrane lipopolysaccharide assembly protein LptE/RlpB
VIIALKKSLVFLIISLFIAGCDYKLRSSFQGLNDLVVSIYFNENSLNQDFATTLKQESGLKKLHLNKEAENTDLEIKILEHAITRYSSALGAGARTKEARLEYHLKISLTLRGEKDNFLLEFKDNSYYSFDESRILAIEEVENRLKENFFKNALKRINFSLLNILNETN